ncbi:hypothetical protein PGIGA_G00197280 [Pangasianodon gigas]|uniref:Uncharacterized protein n=1 Tax=Pangasianodon gigas TaxID=30993 RepID=A0ACC5XZ60_PANGG|nr:hypothetical protein [Pangasianodon gigas]
MCPVRALDAYVHRDALWRRADQLFVCFGPPKRGLPATKQTLSRWIVDAICLAYESSGLPSPLGVKAHSTRSVAASRAFLAGVSMQDICNAADLLLCVSNKELEHKIITLIKNELKRFRKLLSPDYPACTEREVEDEEDLHSVGEGALKITLHVLKNMNHTDLANTLHNKSVASVYQQELKSNLREKFNRINEGISQHGSSALLNEIYTELYITEGWSGDVNNEHEALFEEGAFTRVPRGAGPASAEAERRLRSWGSQMDLAERMETGESLSPSSPTRSIVCSLGSEARSVVSSPRGVGSALRLSSSEEVDVEGADYDSPPQSPQYEELLEVVLWAVAKLNIDWPAETRVEPQKSKLDDVFCGVNRHLHAGACLFSPTSTPRAMPQVEQTLASYLSPGAASSLKAPAQPSRPLRTTSALVGKGYAAASQAGACLHTMAVLQAYQADLLKELDEDVEMTSEHVTELRRAADLSLRATKETARVIGRCMAALVAVERHLWLTLSDMKEKDRVFLMDAPLAPSGLFGDAVSSVVDRGPQLRSPDASGPGLSRAGPSGAERCTPHHTVPVSPQCPREVDLPTLPPMVLQGAAVSGEHFSLFPPGNVAVLGGSLPLRRSPERLVWSFPAGSLLQGTELAALVAPEVSLERLIPLVGYLAAWKLLLNVSQWVLHTVERGYRIQFGSPPPRFCGILPTLVGPEQALVMEQEVNTLLRKEAIEVVPPHDRESGFYSRYFIVPKKGGGLRPILDLRHLNRSVARLKFKILTIKQVVSQISSEDWFVMIDLKDAYFHISILPQHRKFLRFAFGGEAYQYRVLPFGLAISPCTITKCVDAALAPMRLQSIRILNYIDDWLILARSEQVAVRNRDVVLAHMKELGLRLNAEKSVLSPVQRITYLGVV